MSTIKLFGLWETGGIKVDDIGLRPYINLRPLLLPKTGGRNTGIMFHKSKTHIVERLVNKVMVPGHKTKKNPIEVFVKAIENAAPREEITTIEYGGARYPKAVECSPQRRIDIALRLMTQGAYQKSFNSKKGVIKSLADEIISAFNLSLASHAISKKLELERQADSSR